MEHIVVSNIRRHLDLNNILSDSQHGFRNKRSCESQLISFTHDLFNSVSGGGQVDVAVLDFSKAFDKVPHRRLMEKLSFYGIRDNAHTWIYNFLSDRHQQVVLDGCHSDKAPVISGVPQGTVLGPTLFLLYINDLPECVASQVRLFADDCAIYRAIKTEQDKQILQRDLEILHNWEVKWLMDFNPDKCFVLNITRKKYPMLNKYTLKNVTLQTVKTTTYLGIEISNDLRWSPQIEKCTQKANKTLCFLRRNLKTNNIAVKTQAYQALVRPHLEYASQVWDPHTKSDVRLLEGVQRRAARFVSNRYHNTSSCTEMLNTLGWDSLEQRRAKLRLVTLYKITNNIIDLNPSQYLTPSKSCYTSQNLNYERPHTPTNYLKYSFFPRTIAQWNSLPLSIKQSPSLELYKASLLSAHIPDLLA